MGSARIQLILISHIKRLVWRNTGIVTSNLEDSRIGFGNSQAFGHAYVLKTLFNAETLQLTSLLVSAAVGNDSQQDVA